MAKWIEHTGSDEQIAEMENAKNGFICKNDYGYTWGDVYIDWSKCPIGATHYLICNPHPYADMICQWARTGQPVWVRYAKVCHFGQTSEYEICNQIATPTPDWNIPGAEYSFTPFED